MLDLQKIADHLYSTYDQRGPYTNWPGVHWIRVACIEICESETDTNNLTPLAIIKCFLRPDIRRTLYFDGEDDALVRAGIALAISADTLGDRKCTQSTTCALQE